MEGFNLLGKDISRVDGHTKVTGMAIYGNDVTMPGMLYGICRYADMPAAKVLSINTSKAMEVEGVVRIITFADVPGDPKVGVMIRDYYPIINDEVCFSGDVLAVVAAQTYEAACLAADKIEIEYQALDPISDVFEALKPDARLIHPDKESNIVACHHTEKGDVEQGFQNSELIIERIYQVGFQEHAYIEPESITAYIDPSTADIILTGSIQNPHRVRGFVASYLGLPQSSIEIRRSVMGGSFGGKDDTIDHLCCRAALMASLTKLPVKFTYTREHSMVESAKRHPYHMTYKVGFNRSGKINAMRVNILADSGAYAACTPFVTWRSAVQAAGPYEIDHVRVDVKGVYTNNTFTGAMRGFGSPQIVFANESLMDEIAEQCSISPVEVRKINALKQDGVSITGQRFSNHKVSTLEVLDKALAGAEYTAKVAHFNQLNLNDNPIKYGIGMALSYRGCSMGAEGVDTSSALVSINSDGSVNIATGVTENGQGLQTVMSLIAAEALGIPLNRVKFTEPSTAMISDGGPTVASRATITGGNAVKHGADILKQRIFEVVAPLLGTEQLDDTHWQDGLICNKHKPELSISFNEAVNKAKWGGVNLAAYGFFEQPNISWDEEKGCGSPYFTWVYACQIVELSVDTGTGKIEMLGVTAAHDVGQVISKVGFEGQVTGGIAQGFGYGVLEDFNIEHAEVKSENLDSYLLPTIKDIPPIKIIAVENPDPGGPFGAKSIGEPATELAAAAINNALSFALGRRIRQLPLTLEQVVLGYNLKKPVRQSELQLHSENKKHTLRLNGLSVINPSTVEDALSLLQDKQYQAIAGGTDVLVQGRIRTTEQSLVNIAGLSGLCNIEEDESHITIGSGVTFNHLVEHPSIAKYFPLLTHACHTIGSNQIRNRATFGGNIVNAAPCADSVPPAIIYDAEVELMSAIDGRYTHRRMPLSEFITGGYSTELKQGELLTSIILPKPVRQDLIYKYSQLGRRKALNITRLSLSCLLGFDVDGKVDYCQLVDGALFSKPQRLHAIEAILLGYPLNLERITLAEKVLMDMIESAIGGRWSAAYKQPVFINMFRNLLTEIITDVAQGEAR
ncbi:molybdopterin-dependent oxidoreductase [Shewanella sp. D64]|uniref:molybdopterin cofactor-binding domain-containing protein n=1 Tax=unclassified Shewanella TaxID=196818 RepID=UPI0022BA3A4D|nr:MULTISPECIES: molybdopterin cofactor-binding domain-containing protein [unclassified Shewanella]MEC4728704.1 molybdopterin-dependent oxidoreductase [Shewanella sp. D64]MEC4740642.1 molybdopterin-dependent oxidoreductase [Shewanella sp. E94]WBJ94468.1 molybdopterin-dependent oxidoreductase [Shewanella sp. MTB7]